MALHNIHNSGLYNFHYAAMVGDVNGVAANRIYDEYNLYGHPTTFFDGGDEVYVGGEISQTPYVERIQASGARGVHDMDLSVTTTWLGNARIQVEVTVTNNEFINVAPEIPSTPSALGCGATTKSYAFSATSVEPDGQQLYYQWDWGNGAMSQWLGPYASSQSCDVTYAYSQPGAFNVRVKVRDEMNVESDWSGTALSSLYKIGDPNGDTSVNVGDAVYLINRVFKGGPQPQPCNDTGDVNCDGNVNIGDGVYLINHVFKGGLAPGCN